MFVKDIPRSATSYTVSLDKLRQGVTYEFRVVAVNKAGYGEPSRPSPAVSGRGRSGEPRGEILCLQLHLRVAHMFRQSLPRSFLTVKSAAWSGVRAFSL